MWAISTACRFSSDIFTSSGGRSLPCRKAAALDSSSVPSMEGASALAAVFEPVSPPTTFEETVERLGTAIRVGLLPPGSRLPPERELAEQLGIARSTLRQALTTLVQSGHLISLRGRTGGTFVSAAPPLSDGSGELRADWREVLDHRVAVECGCALLAAERANEPAFEHMD